MSARCSPQYSVRSRDHVHVEVYIHLKRGQDHKIQFVHKRSLIRRVSILGSTHLKVIRIRPDVLNSRNVKILNVNNLPNFALALKLTYRPGYSADSPRHFYALSVHQRL